jgi:hypothetical protein
MRNFIQIAIIIGLSVLLFHQCNKNRNIKSTNENNQSALLDSISYYKNSLGMEVAEKLAFQCTTAELEVILQDKRKENEQLNEALKKWKKIANATEINTVTEIKEVPIPFEVKIPCDFSRTFAKQDKWFSIGGMVNQDQIFIENVLLYNTQTVVIGKKKLSMFRSEFRAEVTNSNPYIKTVDIQSFNFIEKNKRFGIGISFGFGVYESGFFIGPSINYNLIQF